MYAKMPKVVDDDDVGGSPYQYLLLLIRLIDLGATKKNEILKPKDRLRLPCLVRLLRQPFYHIHSKCQFQACGGEHYLPFKILSVRYNDKGTIYISYINFTLG